MSTHNKVSDGIVEIVSLEDESNDAKKNLEEIPPRLRSSKR